MTRTIELENDNARNLYAAMLKIIVDKGYPKSYPIDILVDFETITEKRLYEPGCKFIWIVRELGTHLYYEDYIRDRQVFKMHFENSIKHVYLIQSNKYGSPNITEIIPTYENAYQAYCMLPDHIYKEDEN